MIKKNGAWGFWIAYALFIILLILDFVTTYLNQEKLVVIELNPLYHFFGGLFPILLVNILALFLFLWAYFNKKSGVFQRYTVIVLLFCIMFMRIIAVYNALSWYYYPPNLTISELQQVYTPEVIQTARINYLTLMYSPLFFCLITFFFFWLDHRIIKK